MKVSETQKAAAMQRWQELHGDARVERDVFAVALGFAGGSAFTLLVFVALLAAGC
jgi:hypothetical protein